MPSKQKNDQLEKNLNALQAMIVSPGWTLFDAHLEIMEHQAYRHTVGADSAHEMAVNSGVLKTVKGLRGFLEQSIDEIRACLEDPGIGPQE